jgi:L-asparaginase
MRPVIALASVGGTITMTPGAAGGVVPTLTAADLAASVPGLNEHVELRVATLANIPSPSFPIERVWEIAEWGRGEVRDGAAGVILAQGTDTIEETSFLLDLYWDSDAPLVVTGAMRPPRQLSPDGPANLAAACLVAASEQLRGQGAFVVLDDTINLARRVRKTHSWSVGTFASPSLGPVGHVVEGVVRAVRSVRTPVTLTAPRDVVYVPLLETHLGDDATTLRSVLYAGAAGVVIGAFGVGHVSARVADAVAAAVSDGVAVVIATRTGAGGTHRDTYGYEGSEMDLVDKGAILAGELDPRKARTLLWAALASRRSVADVRELFAACDAVL